MTTQPRLTVVHSLQHFWLALQRNQEDTAFTIFDTFRRSNKPMVKCITDTHTKYTSYKCKLLVYWDENKTSDSGPEWFSYFMAPCSQRQNMQMTKINYFLAWHMLRMHPLYADYMHAFNDPIIIYSPYLFVLIPGYRGAGLTWHPLLYASMLHWWRDKKKRMVCNVLFEYVWCSRIIQSTCIVG